MKFHPASSAVTRLELWFHDLKLPHATGFIYCFGQDMALVSNWHVFSGRHPETGNPLNQNRLCPDRVKFHVTDLCADENGYSVKFKEMELPLYEDGKALWWQHPGYRGEDGEPHHVDIGVLSLNGAIADFEAKRKTIQTFESQVIVNISQIDQQMTYEQGMARVGSEVFIIGFPKGLATQGVLPIWKRGSIASEPLYNLEGNVPVFLTDALTRDGMSGSPVIYLGPEIVGEDGSPSSHKRSQEEEPWLLGVYAGRRGSSQDELEMAVGRVWKKALLDFTFFYKVPGGTPPQLLDYEVPDTPAT